MKTFFPAASSIPITTSAGGNGDNPQGGGPQSPEDEWQADLKSENWDLPREHASPQALTWTALELILGS